MIQTILQYNILISFLLLSIIGIINKDWNYGFLMNFSLVFLYISLYVKPFIK